MEAEAIREVIRNTRGRRLELMGSPPASAVEKGRITIDPTTFKVIRAPGRAKMWTARLLGKENKALNGVVTLDGTGSEPSPQRTGMRRLRAFFRKRNKDEVQMLGGSRVQDASRNVL